MDETVMVAKIGIEPGSRVRVQNGQRKLPITAETEKGRNMIRRGRIRLEEHAGDEFSGIQRVLRVLSTIDGRTLRKIDSAHDHKGTLVVVWVEIPDSQDMTSMECAWKDESECLLHYTYPDGSQFEVTTGVTERRPA